MTNLTTDGKTFIYVYHVPKLNTNCYGPVTVIEYCYRYTVVSGQLGTFNWTVLILEEAGSNSFVINRIYVIQSCLPMDSANCTRSGSQITCCDRTSIDTFDLSTMNFIFGVTESAQGNTHNASLLRFADGLSQYLVDTILGSSDDQILSIGSTVMYTTPPPQRGLLMLWFQVLGEHQ